MESDGLEEFHANRGRLFAIAYRMLGSAADAEDVVQDAWLRWRSVDHDGVANPGAFLAKTVTNLCLNVLDSARARREVYVGPWLPEPVLTGPGRSAPPEVVEQRDAVSFAMLTLLEKLSPAERAAYILRAAFGHSHREIAELIGVSEAHARQLYARARAAVGSRRARAVDRAQWTELVVRFLSAAQEGDIAALESMLARDATSWADGGGVVRAARNPVHSSEKIARYFAGIAARFAEGAWVELAEANSEPCVLVLTEQGLLAVMFFEVVDGKIANLWNVLNPRKIAFAAAQL